MPDTIIKNTEEKMKKSIQSFQEELKTVRTGRPNPEVFKKVKVTCYGMPMNLQDTATITVPDGQSFLIQPFDKANLKAIEDAINSSDLGFNANNDGNNIRIVVPPLSKERRDEMVKKVSKMSEERGNVPIRNIRQAARDEIKKLKEQSISEDEIKKLNEQLEKITTKCIAEIDSMTAQKQKELTQV